MTNGFECKIITDSIYQGSRITTFQLRYPRFIHSEFMTHRVFSRNASSSRAIPVAKMIAQVEDAPAIPVHWGKNQKGMQADEELSPEQKSKAHHLWCEAARNAAKIAKEMEAIGLHKQVANRILEPFQFINVVMTTTEIQNYFKLRCHKDADPNIHVLADMMALEYGKSFPKELTLNDYHLPYILDSEKENHKIEDLLKFSVARCARVSYQTHDKQNPKPEDDIALYDRLVGSEPIHASPTEHQARPFDYSMQIRNGMNAHGNFNNKWAQYRKYVEHDAVKFFVEPHMYTKRDLGIIG